MADSLKANFNKVTNDYNYDPEYNPLYNTANIPGYNLQAEEAKHASEVAVKTQQELHMNNKNSNNPEDSKTSYREIPDFESSVTKTLSDQPDMK